MSYVKDCEFVRDQEQGRRSNSSQGLATVVTSSAVKIPLPPRLWITGDSVLDAENDSSDCSDVSKDDAFVAVERARVRSRFRHYKQRCVVNVPIGIFWDIENCQVPRGCSALDVVSAIRNKFLTGRREADFVVVCDVRKEAATRLQELNDAQVNLIHVCGTQKNAADEKLRQCMRRFGELHGAPAALLLISGDINFAADLSDFRHRKNIEVILVHKQNTSPALIACATSHYSFNDLTDDLPRHPKSLSQTDEEEPTCEMEVTNLPLDQPAERVSKRLRRLADNCGGKVLRVTAPTAVLKFPTPDHAARALKRMEGEDVFGRKIGTRYLRSGPPPTYSSDEGYSTGTTQPPVQPPRPESLPPRPDSLPLRPESLPPNVHTQVSATVVGGAVSVSQESRWWWRALQQLPADPSAPPAPPALLPPPAAPPRPRKIRGTHGSSNLNRSGGSSSNSEDRGREASASRAVSPWNCSGSASEHSDAEEGPAELTIANLPPFEPVVLQQMLGSLLSQYVGVVRVSVWGAAEGPVASVVVRSEWDARLAIARVHKRRLDSQWNGRRLELAVGRPSPAPNLDTLRARLRAILLEQPNHCLPLLRLRDAYASRHCCALTTSDLAKVKDTVIIHEGLGRIVQLVDLSPVVGRELEAAPWKCGTHARAHSGCEDAAAVLQPVVIEIAVLTKHVHMLLESHGGIIPLLSFVDCYECSFPPLCVDSVRGVPLELLLRAVGGAEVRDAPARHLAWKPHSVSPSHSRISDSSMCSSERERERERPRTAPALEPMLALFERELVDLLRSAPRCCIPFSKLIPAFHHHFGRQCRVADYGFTKLPDLLAALSNTIVVLGSGSSRVITLSAAAQGRRWSSDLVKLLKTLPGRAVHPQDIPQLYQATFGRPFTPVNYGVCTVAELMERVTPHLVTVGPDGSLSLPRPTPTAEEKARTVHFAMQTVELLCYTPNFRMEFSRFVPAYHAHFGRQLRVAHYGCVKLVELFELISDTVTVCCEPTGEKSVSLATHTARSVMGERLRTLGVIPLEALSGAYAAMWGGPPCAEALGARSLEHAVFACGGSVEHGLVRPPGDSPKFANDALATCAVLAADKSVARGSTIEYLTSALRRSGIEVELEQLEAAGVVEVCARRVRMSGEWRAAWRIARVLAATPPAAPHHVLDMYIERYGQDCYTQQGIGGMLEVLCEHPSVFCESGGLWELRGGVAPPPPPPPAAHPHKQEDYSLHDTPPGQKGSRVFESPKVNIWCSPPASALPVPTALLTNDNKRRTRLAAQFDAV